MSYVWTTIAGFASSTDEIIGLYAYDLHLTRHFFLR